MSIISLSNITKSFGPVSLFNGLSLSFHAGRKVGLIGPNGSGKSTIFRLIMGLEQPDSGAIVVKQGLRIGYLPQEPSFADRKTVFGVMKDSLCDLTGKLDRLKQLSSLIETLDGPSLTRSMAELDRLSDELDKENVWAIEALIKRTLCNLGLKEEYHHAPIQSLSGGQVSRLGLACILLRETDLLLLDEPTNHLDLGAIGQLEIFLRNYPGAVVLVCHDRFLLNHFAQQIIEIDNRAAVSYKGNYSRYVQIKERARLHHERTLSKRKDFVKRTLDFISRNKDQEGMRGTARGRKKRLESLL